MKPGAGGGGSEVAKSRIHDNPPLRNPPIRHPRDPWPVARESPAFREPPAHPQGRPPGHPPRPPSL
eukprot:10400761-Alexandrium_andersonii.AAC.1